MTVTWTFARPLAGESSYLVVGLTADRRGYTPGVRDVSPAEAALVTRYLGLTRFSEIGGMCFATPDSVSSPTAAFELLLERAARGRP